MAVHGANRSALLPAFLAAWLLVGCAGGPNQVSTGQFIDDRVITTKVKTQLLRDEGTSGLAINVDTYKGTVLLNGFVDSQEEKQRAEEIARRVPGVKTVKNALVVKHE